MARFKVITYLREEASLKDSLFERVTSKQLLSGGLSALMSVGWCIRQQTVYASVEGELLVSAASCCFLSRPACRELWPRERRKLQVIFHSNEARGGEKHRKVLISCCSLGEFVFVANWKKICALNVLKSFEYLSVFNCFSLNLTFYHWAQ